jgi:predicted AlkP superfamily phosphohydrolase/phosphomutase
MGLRYLPDSTITCPPFWDYLSRAGVRVGVVDIPEFPLSRSVNGFQLANWGAHAGRGPPASTPPWVLDEVNMRFGRHPVGDCDAKPHAELRRRVIDGVRSHGELFRWLMREQPWDVFFATFSEGHCAGHHFWRGVDTSHPKHDQAADHGLSDTVELVYRAIDNELGTMIEMVGRDTRVIVFATHETGPIYHASWNLPEILGLLGYGRKRVITRGGAEARVARINPWRVLKMIIPASWQYRIKAMMPEAMQDQLLFLWYANGRNWAGSRAFAIPNNEMVGSIRVAVRGRDQNGIVEPGEEYHRICRNIGQALSELTDPETKRCVVKRILF